MKREHRQFQNAFTIYSYSTKMLKIILRSVQRKFLLLRSDCSTHFYWEGEGSCCFLTEPNFQYQGDASNILKISETGRFCVATENQCFIPNSLTFIYRYSKVCSNFHWNWTPTGSGQCWIGSNHIFQAGKIYSSLSSIGFAKVPDQVLQIWGKIT